MTPKPTLEQRVWAKVNFDGPGGCWLWTGALSKKRNNQRRPAIQEGGRGSRVLNVARLVLSWYQGPPPTPLHEAGHTCPEGECDRCINPQHLAWQTREENERQKQKYRGTRVADGTGECTDTTS